MRRDKEKPAAGGLAAGVFVTPLWGDRWDGATFRTPYKSPGVAKMQAPPGKIVYDP